MMLYKDTKAMVRSFGDDTDFFDIVIGILEGNALGLYMFTICQDYMLRTSRDLIKESGFTLKTT